MHLTNHSGYTKDPRFRLQVTKGVLFNRCGVNNVLKGVGDPDGKCIGLDSGRKG
jgi:hypothetical protein